MRLFFCLCFLAILVIAPPSRGETREHLGVGRLVNNDALATLFDDRWRTGSAVVSAVRARDAALGWPSRMGDVVEYRLRGSVITPANIVVPAAGDRPYAGTLSFGLHTHFAPANWAANWQMSLGADVAVTGPQTGLPTLQSAIHDVLGVAEPSAATLAAQIPNGVHAHGTLEVARPFALGGASTLRPFFELQAGVETLARAGGDIHIGQLALGELMLRDVSTGQRYRVGAGAGTGWAAVLGADVAYVADSLYLPPSSGVVATDTRTRLRAGVHWSAPRVGVFYGVTWLSKEFEAQPEGQAIGSLRLDFKF